MSVETVGLVEPQDDTVRSGGYFRQALGQYCDVVSIIWLDNEKYEQLTVSDDWLYPVEGEQHWTSVYFDNLRTFILPCDYERADRVFLFEQLKKSYEQGETQKECQFRINAKDGTIAWMESKLQFIREDGGSKVLMTTCDITQEKHLEQEQRTAQRYDLALRSIYDELYELNVSQDSYQVVYHTTSKYVVPPESGVLSKTIPLVAQNMIHPEDRTRFQNFFNLQDVRHSVACGRDSFIGEFRKLWEDGEYHWASLTLFPMMESADNLDEIYLCFIMDISDKKRMEFDALTRIYNESGFFSHTERLLRENPEQRYAVIRIDVNRFKFINEICGMTEGDNLLCRIADVMRENTTPRDTCGRMNSDIFCFLKSFDLMIEVNELIDKIYDAIAHSNLTCRPSLSFGVYVVDEHDTPAHILCDRANLALRTIKGNMLKRWALYDTSLRERLVEERQFENEMEDALTQSQFCVYLQPKHDLATSKVVGAEALVRWNHPREGLLAPGRFIPLFERNGFIVKLDAHIWEKTFQILRGWLDRGIMPVPVSMNVSRVHIYSPDFVAKVLNLMDKYQLPGNLVELELTESAFVEHTEELYRNMELLKNAGIIFSMDDFGSGYSSLNMLKEAPVNTIKLDREFLNQSSTTERGQIIVENTVRMAKQLHLDVVAEGVETRQQADFLNQSGCAVAQGFLFSRPMPVSQFEALAFATEKE